MFSVLPSSCFPFSFLPLLSFPFFFSYFAIVNFFSVLFERLLSTAHYSFCLLPFISVFSSIYLFLFYILYTQTEKCVSSFSFISINFSPLSCLFFISSFHIENYSSLHRFAGGSPWSIWLSTRIITFPFRLFNECPLTNWHRTELHQIKQRRHLVVLSISIYLQLKDIFRSYIAWLCCHCLFNIVYVVFVMIPGLLYIQKGIPYVNIEIGFQVFYLHSMISITNIFIIIMIMITYPYIIMIMVIICSIIYVVIYASNTITSQYWIATWFDSKFQVEILIFQGLSIAEYPFAISGLYNKPYNVCPNRHRIHFMY